MDSSNIMIVFMVIFLVKLTEDFGSCSNAGTYLISPIILLIGRENVSSRRPEPTVINTI